MADSTDPVRQVDDKIAEAASTGIQSTSVDGVSVTQMSVSDLIKAADYLKKGDMDNIYKALGIFKVNLK